MEEKNLVTVSVQAQGQGPLFQSLGSACAEKFAPRLPRPRPMTSYPDTLRQALILQNVATDFLPRDQVMDFQSRKNGVKLSLNFESSY